MSTASRRPVTFRDRVSWPASIDKASGEIDGGGYIDAPEMTAIPKVAQLQQLSELLNASPRSQNTAKLTERILNDVYNAWAERRDAARDDEGRHSSNANSSP